MSIPVALERLRAETALSVRSPAAVLLVSLLLGCAAARPVLYPNAHLREVGEAAAQREIDACLGQAKASGYEKHPEREIAKDTAGGAAAGAAVGTAVGAVVGNVGRGAGTGAAAGGTHGLLRGMRGARDPDPIQKRFVEECLAEQGFKTIGWR